MKTKRSKETDTNITLHISIFIIVNLLPLYWSST